MIDPRIVDFGYFVAGVLAGMEGVLLSKTIWEHLGPRKTPAEMEDMAAELRATSRRMAQLAEVCERLANGEDPETMDMPDDIRKSYEEWSKK